MTHYHNPGLYHDQSPAAVCGYRIADDTLTKEIEADLFSLFDELDAVILDAMPNALLVPPAQLIREILYQKYGIFIAKEAILDSYCRYLTSEFSGGFEHE